MKKQFVFIASFIKDGVLLSWFLSNYSGLCEKCSFKVYEQISAAVKAGMPSIVFRFSDKYQFLVKFAKDRYDVFRVY